METLIKFSDSKVNITFTMLPKSFTIYIYNTERNFQALVGTINFPLQEYVKAINYFYRLTKIYKTISDKKFFFSTVEKIETRSEKEVADLTVGFFDEVKEINEQAFVVHFLETLLKE